MTLSQFSEKSGNEKLDDITNERVLSLLIRITERKSLFQSHQRIFSICYEAPSEMVGEALGNFCKKQDLL